MTLLGIVNEKNPLNQRFKGFFVGLLGLEPRMTAPKTGVLPLHHRPISSANLIQSFYVASFF